MFDRWIVIVILVKTDRLLTFNKEPVRTFATWLHVCMCVTLILFLYLSVYLSVCSPVDHVSELN